jgi:hypothetical protein
MHKGSQISSGSRDFTLDTRGGAMERGSCTSIWEPGTRHAQISLVWHSIDGSFSNLEMSPKHICIASRAVRNEKAVPS